MTLARRVFLIAGTYGVLTMAPMYFMESRIGRDFPPPITHPEHFYGFVGVTLVWQLLFFLVAGDPVRFRPIMLASVLEKVSFGAAAVVLFFQARATMGLLAFGLVDLLLAVFFLLAYRATPRLPRVPDATSSE
jgi:hypothetical protein